nr:hypothetical protein [Tanacetum cinerariifolium]
MPPEPVSIDRKELKPSLSESDATIVCKDMPSTPSSCRYPGRPFSGYGTGVGEKRGLEKGNSLGSSGLDWKPVVVACSEPLMPSPSNVSAAESPSLTVIQNVHLLPLLARLLAVNLQMQKPTNIIFTEAFQP